MQTILVEHVFAAPPNAVFAAISDHEQFCSGRGTRCELLQEGRPDRNGNGAVRRIASGALIFIEDISAFEPPVGFEYHVRSLTLRPGLNIPFRHQLGRISLMPEASGTRVRWESRFTIAWPLIGGLLERRFQVAASAAFAGLLRRCAAALST